jgi:glycosyltransferase involved in cell wall biosynthesis
MSTTKLAVVSTHPIQYHAPVFRCLASSVGIDLRVFYTWSQRAEGLGFDGGFREKFSWDIPLLEGYAYEFVPNQARNPGSHHFLGLRNPTLLGAIERWKPDAVLVYGWNNWSHLQVLRYFKGRVPLLFRGDSTLLDQRSPLRSAARRTLLHWVYSHVDLVISVGQCNRDYFLWCGVSPSKIGFAPHCVDTKRFANDTEHGSQADAWRRTLAMGDDTVVVLFAGKLQPKKDPEMLLKAYQDLDRPDTRLVFVGTGELEQLLKERAGADVRVHFAGFQNQSVMPAAYRMGDVLVMPSRGPGETWGLALNEAMASGRPVVASSKVGGARDLVRDGITGWQFEAGDRRSLGLVLDRSVGLGRARLHALGRSARDLIGHWTVEECAGKIANLALEQVAQVRRH